MKMSRSSSLPRNSQTIARHTRESWLQIFLPFLLALVLLGVGLLWLGGKGVLSPSQAAQIVLIGLILPAMLVVVLLLVLTLGLLVGVTKVLRVLPFYAFRGQELAAMLAQRVRSVADASVEPLLRLQEWAAMWQCLRRGGMLRAQKTLRE